MITHRHRGNALADRFDDAATFVTEDAWEDTFRVFAGERVSVGVADASRNDAHQHLASLGRLDVHFDNLQRLIGGKRDCGTGLDGHGWLYSWMNSEAQCSFINGQG